MSEKAPFMVFSGTNSRYLAEKICASLDCPLGNMNITHFADGEFAVSYEESIRGAHVFLVQSTFPNSDNLMELLLMVDAAKRASAKSIVAVIPYFGWARQDRKDKPRVSIGAKLVADLLSVAGIDRLITMDLHADQIQGFFNIPVDHLYASAVFQLIIAIGIGTIFSWALTKTGLTFPIYIGAMIAAALMRNIAEYAGNGKLVIHMGEINDLGGISLSLFLGMAMITLKLWQLASLALPLVILLGAQIIVIVLFTYFIVFNIMGKDYDAAVLVAGTCGFGMGATPNAMANMQAVCDKYVPSVKAYLLIPLIGSLFADFLNSLVITFFINIL